MKEVFIVLMVLRLFDLIVGTKCTRSSPKESSVKSLVKKDEYACETTLHCTALVITGEGILLISGVATFARMCQPIK
jgi:hypothetical protein